jgi:hypothetical protein
MRKRNTAVEDYIGTNDFAAIERGMNAAAARDKKLRADIAYSEGRARSRQARFEDFDDKLRMQNRAEDEAERRRKEKIDRLIRQSQGHLDMFKQAGKSIDESVRKAGGKYQPNMSMTEEFKFRQGMQARGEYPNDVVRRGRE